MVDIEQIKTPAFVVDVCADGSFRYRHGNRPFHERTALGQHRIEGETPTALLPPLLASVVEEKYGECSRTGAVLTFEEQFRVGSGLTHWRTTLVPLKDGEATILLGVVVEITDSKREELDLHRANAQLNLALQAVQGTHWQYDIANNSFEASPSLALLLGEAAPRAVSLDEWVKVIPLADRPRASFHTLVDGSQREQITQFRVATPSGGERWLKCRRIAVKGSANHAQMIFGVTVDVTEEVLREQRLTREAQHDGLTHLLNRRGFLAQLDAVVAESSRDGSSLSILMLDLDRFKAVNDTLGHAAGDAVLAAVAERIEAVLGPGDFASRLGGDEFAIALRRLDENGVAPLVARLRRRLSWPCPFREHLIPVSASIGVARWTPGQGSLAVMEAADLALYGEKRASRRGASGGDASLRRTA